jgi:signal transduction histidine kinase
MPRLWLLFALPLLCLLALARVAAADTAVHLGLVEGQTEYPVTGVVRMMRDESGLLTVDALARGEAADAFQPLQSRAPALGQTSDALWFRVALHNPGQHPLRINWVIGYIFLEQLDFYQVRSGDVLRHKRLGKLLPYGARDVDLEPYIFPVTLAGGESADLYLRVVSSVPIMIPQWLLTDLGIAERTHFYHVFLGIYVGVLLSMILYNLFLFVSIRDVAYLYYVLMVGGGGLTQLGLLGLMDQFTPDWVGYNRIAGNFFACIGIIFGLLFTWRILEVGSFGTLVRGLFKGCITLFIVLAVASALNIPEVHVPVTAGVGMMSLLVLAIAVIRVVQGYEPARYFMMAWAVLTVGAVISSGLYGGLVPYNTFTVWAFPLASGIEAMLLSFALAARINLLRRQHHEAEMAAQKALMESQAKGQFLAQMNHEIRTPMSGVLGMTDLLAQTHLDAQQRQFVDIIGNSGEALLTILNDILDFSTIASGKMPISKDPFDLEKLVADCVQMFALPASGKGLFLRADWDEAVPAVVSGDPVRIRQVLSNLLSNAFKFTDQGGVTLEVQWLETFPQVGEPSVMLLRFAVSDTGVGISPEHQQRLFSAFSQAGVGTSQRFGNAGLGLSICRQLAELMGGEVGLHSQPGQGSTFWFTVRVGEDLSSDVLMNRQRLLTQLRQATWAFIDEGRALVPLMRLLGHQGPPLAWSAAAVGLADLRPRNVLVRVDSPGRLRRTLELMQDRPPQQRWVIILPPGLAPGQEQVLKDAGAELVTEPVLVRSGWHALAMPLQRRETPRGQRELHGHVLVAEDNVVNQKVIGSMLRKLGLSVEIVADGHLALERATLDRARYSLVLMDCEMPGLDGYQAAAGIRAWEKAHECPPLPILALSAHVMPEHLEAVRQSGMDEAVPKPVGLDMLREALARHLPE